MVRKIKATIPAAQVIETVKVEAPKQESFSFGDLLPEGATWKRTITAWTIGLLASCGIGYGAGMLLDMLIVGAATLTGSLFLCVAIYIVGVVLAMWAGNKVAKIIYLSIMNKTVDMYYTVSKDYVTELFSSKEPS
jgi:high-affinity Fe2+/Pb2+ permease